MTLITISAIYSRIFARYDNPSPYARRTSAPSAIRIRRHRARGARLRFPEYACYPITAEVNALI